MKNDIERKLKNQDWKHFVSRIDINALACTFFTFVLNVIIIIRFLINVQVQGHIHDSGPPSRQLACCTHGRSHTRSPGVSIMRDDSWELPLSAIPLCQLLPSHLGPPGSTLSINLYIKGCLDCTVGAFHMSILEESSLFQYEVQVFNAEPCK